MKTKKFLSLTLVLIMLSSVLYVVPASAATFDREQFYIDAKAQYGDLDWSDPQHITDEEFFGLWNGESWEKEPYFDYEQYPELAAVEAAAKQHDYDTCKDEIYDYYKDKYSKFNLSSGISKTTDYRTQERREAWFDNFAVAYQNSISARIVFDENYGWASTDFRLDVQEKAKSTEAKTMKLQLVAAKKDGYMVEVATRETDHAPYLKVLVNGAYRTYTAVADTYVTGLEPNKSHADSETMLVEESVSSIGAYRRKDENTKVSLLQFNLDDLTPNDQITEATLYLYGRMVESTTPGGVRIPSTQKSVFVMPFIRGDSNNLDEKITHATYSGYTGTYTSFNGEEGPTYHYDPITGQASNAYALRMTTYLTDITQGYVATGNEDYAWHTLRIILKLIKDGGTYEEFAERIDHAGKENLPIGIYLGGFGYEFPMYLDRFIESKHMNSEIMTTMLKWSWNMAKYLVEHWGTDEELNNWGTYHTRGLSALAMYFPEFRAAHDPLTGKLADPNCEGSVTGGWIAVSNFRFDYKLKDDILVDGASIEVSNDYAFQSLSNLARPIITGEQIGVDPTPYMSPEMTEKLEKNVMYILNNTNPWFGDWQYGDGEVYTSNYATRLNSIMKIYKDNPYMQWFASNRKNGIEPDYKTTVYDTVGKVTFRNNWTDQAVAGHLEASSGYLDHGHNDDLSLTLAAYGQYLLVDPLMGLYDTTEPNESWLSSTRGHNTVEINDTIAKGGKTYTVGKNKDMFDKPTKYPIKKATKLSDLYPGDRELNETYDYVRGETFGYTDHDAMEAEGWGDYQVIRDTLFMHKGYFIITDYINPEDKTKSDNNYKQLWHFLPSADIKIDEKQKNTIKTNFDGAANLVVATVDDEETELKIEEKGIYATKKSVFVDAKYAYYEKKDQQGITTFNTLLYPTKPQQKVNVHTKNLTLDIPAEKANAFEARIEDESSNIMTTVSYYTLFDETEKAERGFGNFITDGMLALAEQEENVYTSAVLRKGSQIKDVLLDKYMVYSTVDVEDLGVEWNGTNIELSTSHTEGDDALELTRLTIAANGEVSNVRLNGEEIAFKQQGRYVYFGTNPIIIDEVETDDEEEDDDDEEEDVPQHGGGSGKKPSGGGSSGGSGGGGSISLGGGSVTVPGTTNIPNSFADSKGHWAEEYILSATESGIVKGDEKGNFNPENKVTRAELISMVIRALDTDEKEIEFDNTFSDVAEDSWYAKSISAALSMGLISPSITFRPNDPINREEMCKILVGFAEKLGLEMIETGELAFSDDDDISPWAKDFVKKAVALGLMNGMEDNTFGAKSTATRAQAVTVIQRAREKR